MSAIAVLMILGSENHELYSRKLDYVTDRSLAEATADIKAASRDDSRHQGSQLGAIQGLVFGGS